MTKPQPRFIKLLLQIFIWPSCFAAATLQAQLNEPSFSFSLQPTLSNRFIIYKSPVSNAYKDSIAKADRGRPAIGGSFLFSFKTGRKQRLYTGLQFRNLGFIRKKENIRFLDTIHPDIGIMNDLSQTGGAYVDFIYRYQYLSLPLLFSVQLSKVSRENTRIHWLYGGSADLLLHHDIHAVFHGFSLRGGIKNKKLKNSEGQPERINVTLQTGLRIENLIYGKDTWIFLQPELMVPVLNANGSRERHRLWALGLQVGIIYHPTKVKEL